MKTILILTTATVIGWLTFVGCILYIIIKEPSINKEPSLADIDREYAVELVNQNTVKVYSYSTHKLYTVPLDSIVSVFDIDNL